MKSLPSQQTTFLLRVWRSNSEWRISLEDPMTGERSGFSKLEALAEFLKNDMERPTLPEKEDDNRLEDTNPVDKP
jgi:hypothetical protein